MKRLVNFKVYHSLITFKENLLYLIPHLFGMNLIRILNPQTGAEVRKCVAKRESVKVSNSMLMFLL